MPFRTFDEKGIEFLKELGFDENETYDVPDTPEEASEASIQGFIEQCKRESGKMS